MQPVVLDVAELFAKTPGGRYEKQGPYSGEEFRKKLLEPELKKGHNVVVDIDGTEGAPPSFLEEIFGGVVRSLGISVRSRISVRASTKPWRAAMALGYLQGAKPT